jgi:hypothetical protein
MFFKEKDDEEVEDQKVTRNMIIIHNKIKRNITVIFFQVLNVFFFSNGIRLPAGHYLVLKYAKWCCVPHPSCLKFHSPDPEPLSVHFF